ANAEDVLYMATAGGAKVLARDDIGYLAPGMAADFILMNWNQMQYAGGCNDPVDCIVLSGDARMVETVVVDGVVVVRNGHLTRVDETEKTVYINQVGRALLESASGRVPGLKADLVN
ncbi:MAG: amidohydrolase family protein, partial [Anaerotruncus colihominis]